MVDKKYQIFVSSTYTDLKEERMAVLNAILDMGHIPTGMEYFPAMDEEQLKRIYKVIDESDYYVLILAARYGSVDDDGISYTEREYDYAVSKGKRVIALVHANPDKIENKKTDKDENLFKKLIKFRNKVENGRLVSFWENTTELVSNFQSSLIRIIQLYPEVGWSRGGIIQNSDVQLKIKTVELEIQNIKNENKELLDKNKELDNKNKELLDHFKELNINNAKLRIQITELNIKNKELLDQNKELDNQNKELLVQNEKIGNKIAGLIAQNKELLNKNDELDNKNKELIGGNQEIQEKNKVLIEEKNRIHVYSEDISKKYGKVENAIKILVAFLKILGLSLVISILISILYYFNLSENVKNLIFIVIAFFVGLDFVQIGKITVLIIKTVSKE